MLCSNCGATIAYNVHTGHYFAIAYAIPPSITSPCFGKSHTPNAS